jgi:hypothetical protein
MGATWAFDNIAIFKQASKQAGKQASKQASTRFKVWRWGQIK